MKNKILFFILIFQTFSAAAGDNQRSLADTKKKQAEKSVSDNNQWLQHRAEADVSGPRKNVIVDDKGRVQGYWSAPAPVGTEKEIEEQQAVRAEREARLREAAAERSKVWAEREARLREAAAERSKVWAEREAQQREAAAERSRILAERTKQNTRSPWLSDYNRNRTVQPNAEVGPAMPAAAQQAEPSKYKIEDCPNVEITANEYSFARMNPPVTGVSRTIFRGAYEANKQFYFEKALAGLFYQKNWYVGSPMFWGITQVLTGKWDLNNKFIPSGGLPKTMAEYFHARGILTTIQELLRCRSSYSLEESEIIAQKLMNQVFTNLRDLENTYFNIRAPGYYDDATTQLGFGNNAVDLIIGTNYDQVSSLYGNKTLVLKDVRNRSLDLGYFNYAKNNIFFTWWVDNGEINLPGYVTADELEGFQQREKDREQKGWGQALPDNEIDYAIYRHVEDGEVVVLLLDGDDSLCMLQAEDRKYYICKDYWSNKEFLKGPVEYPVVKSTNKSDQVGLMAVLTTCKDDVCPVADKVLEWYGKKSSRTISESLVKKIKSVQVNGESIQIYKGSSKKKKK